MITPFKKRKIDFDKPVRVYRNLNRKGVVWSIKQGAYVVAHATELVLQNCKLIVWEAGRQRVIKEQSKNVHAFVTGYVLKDRSDVKTKWFPLRYNPYKYESFQIRLPNHNWYNVAQGSYVKFDSKGAHMSQWEDI